MGKTVASTAIQNNAYKVFPNDLNSNGTVFGGLVMSLLDRIALIIAERHSEKTCVTASVDALHFLAPAHMGDILLCFGCLNRAWTTSMEIGVKIVAENYKTGEHTHLVSAYFTYVAMGDDNLPTRIAPVIPETEIEKKRFEDAGRRRANRLKEAELKKKC